MKQMTDHLSKLADDVFTSVRGYIARHLDPLLLRVKALEERAPEKGEKGEDGINGRDGKDVSPEVVAAAVIEAVEKVAALIPKPRDGIDGKSVEPEAVEKMVRKAVESIPVPQNGKDGLDGKDGVDADPEAITKAVLVKVSEVLDSIPVPKDGKDAEVDVDALVESVISKMPVPVNGKDGIDGKSVAVEDLVPVIAEHVKAAVEQIPPAKDGRDGKDVDPEFVTQLVKSAVDEIPKPRDGVDAPPVDVGLVVAEVLKHVPTPKDGRDGVDADPVAIAAQIDVKVERAVASIPSPKDGKDADPEVVRELVQKAVETIPKPRDGVDGTSVDVEVVIAEVLKQVPKPENGIDGKDGRDGVDADPVAIAAQINEAVDAKVEKAVAAIPVPKDGINGKDADPEFIRAEVAKQVDAIPKPQDGRDGLEGQPGRDAIHIDVLEGIDTNKRYQRGTFAYFKGGMIRSFRATDPITDGIEKAGWHVVVNGTAEEAFDVSDDMRTFTHRKVFTDGRVFEKSIRVPTVIYRGIWNSDGVYTKGDQATRDGSQWTLMTDVQAGKPGEPDSGWLLSAKRGTSGRDGNRGEKGDRGAEGRAGRDLTQVGPDGAKWG